MAEQEPNPAPPEPTAATSFHVRRAVGGDRGSLGWLVERLSPLLLEQARYRIGSRLRAHCDPEDLVNDAWLIVLPRLSTIEGRDGRFTPSLLKFLSTALLYRVQNLVRAKDQRRGAAGEPGASASVAVSQAAADATGVVSQAIRSETQRQVLEALAALEQHDREILVLRGIEQHRNQTVARQLGLSPQAVAMRFGRALERLRSQLPDSVFDELDP